MGVDLFNARVENQNVFVKMQTYGKKLAETHGFKCEQVEEEFKEW